MAYLEAGDLARAQQHLEAALRVQPFDPAVRCGLAKIYADTGRQGPAERETSACRMAKGK
jgi:Tfp pilus assembly protein PilF